jgi:phenylpyruvate tautomerase PptA (4-oxalocrotonate tautomerase family)
MPTVTIRYTLPDEQHEYDAARLGRAACGTLWDIDQGLRSLLKHGEPSEQTAKLAEEIREMIREGCPEALEL